jgi:hypothetical protein
MVSVSQFSALRTDDFAELRLPVELLISIFTYAAFYKGVIYDIGWKTVVGIPSDDSTAEKPVVLLQFPRSVIGLRILAWNLCSL